MRRENETPRVHITSLGCPKNLVDTEAAAGSLAVDGIHFANDPGNADIAFISTCAFIEPAREETEAEIRNAVEWKKGGEGRKIIVAGCLVQWDVDRAFRAEFPEVDLWLPVDEIPRLAEHVRSLFDTVSAGNASFPDAPPPPTSIVSHETPRLQLTPAHFAYLKISDGCANNCAYCAIPSIRGVPRHRSIASIATETANLVENGVAEIIVAAQDTTAYRCPETGGRLPELLRELDSIDAPLRLRLLYAHPAGVSDELAALFADSKRLIPYIDLPLQHASDRILAAMNRRIDNRGIRAVIGKLRSANPDIAIRTTLITGFPGETEKDFQTLLDFVGEMEFDRMGAFAYVKEPGTPAADMPDQVPAEIAEKRRAEVMEAQAAISLAGNERLVGEKIETVIDGFIDADTAIGRTERDAPDIDNVVIVHSAGKLEPGTRADLEITSAAEYHLEARPVADGKRSKAKRR